MLHLDLLLLLLCFKLFTPLILLLKVLELFPLLRKLRCDLLITSSRITLRLCLCTGDLALVRTKPSSTAFR
jgi:hypothetical protein